VHGCDLSYGCWGWLHMSMPAGQWLPLVCIHTLINEVKSCTGSTYVLDVSHVVPYQLRCIPASGSFFIMFTGETVTCICVRYEGHTGLQGVVTLHSKYLSAAEEVQWIVLVRHWLWRPCLSCRR
jgi:hypothetical protein